MKGRGFSKSKRPPARRRRRARGQAGRWLVGGLAVVFAGLVCWVTARERPRGVLLEEHPPASAWAQGRMLSWLEEHPWPRSWAEAPVGGVSPVWLPPVGVRAEAEERDRSGEWGGPVQAASAGWRPAPEMGETKVVSLEVPELERLGAR